MKTLQSGKATLAPHVENGFLHSLGTVEIGGTALRNASTRWLPWFDTFEGGLFNRFRFEGIQQRGDTQILRTTAVCDNDYPFRERRDSSGDLCFRTANWDTPPLESTLDICFEEARADIGGHAFLGFKYWFEYEGEAPIHRLIDRQTWEIGGDLDDLHLVCRNWLTPPRVKIESATEYSTVGMGQWSQLLPGNLWARWSLLPAFDLQYGNAGVLLGRFDEVSLIRTVIESNAGEACIRVLDMHEFEQSNRVATNAKTILYCADALSHTDALNLWTRVHDEEAEKARRQFGIPEDAPAIIFAENRWSGIRLDSSYEHVVEVASEFGSEYVFIDAIWENQQALHEDMDHLVPAEARRGTALEKFWHQNMCVTLDFEVARIHGGEAGLKALCERAAKKNIKIMTWMALHLSPNSILSQDAELGSGAGGIYAGRESGRHPDTGYPASCWTLNLNAPIAEKIKTQLLGVCERTGLAGYLWDSYCNLGWWQLDYSNGTMRPQWDKMAALHAALVNAGLYVMPEALVGFSNCSACGLHGGNIYEGDLLGYSYNSNIALWFGGASHETNAETAILRGQAPLDELFQCFAHKRIPNMNLHHVPRAEWDAASAARIKELFAIYRENKSSMQTRTVLEGGAGVLWESANGEKLLWSFRDQKVEGEYGELSSGCAVSDGHMRANRVYRQADAR